MKAVPRFTIKRDKLTAYLLDITSPDGASKAKFFLGRGFDLEDWFPFVEALAQHSFDHWPGVPKPSPYGIKHVLVGPMLCPDGTYPDVCSVWMLSPDSTDASLVTAYPA